MPRLRFLRPSTGLGLEKRGIHPPIWPFIGRFYYLRLFAWLLLALISASLISPRPLPGLWTRLRAQPNTSVMSISPTLSLPAVLSCATPPLIRSCFSSEDCSRFAPDAPPQGQKSRVTAFPPAMPPLADLFYILFLTELPPSAFAASFS